VRTGVPLIDINSAMLYLRFVSDELIWLLRHIESQDGYFRFPPVVIRAIENLKIQSYPLLYEHANAIGFCFLRGSLSEVEIRSLNQELIAATPTERGNFILDFFQDLTEQVETLRIPRTLHEEQIAIKQFEALPEDEKSAAIRQGQHLWMGFLAQFHELLSVMVHGEKLTDLVAKAKAGDDIACVKSVQIDKRILTTIPHFRDRFQRAHMEGDQGFIDQLNYRLSCAPYKGKIRHKPLWFAFAFLDMCGLLDEIPHLHLLDLLDDVGIAGYPSRIDDVKHLSRRLADYRRFQRSGLALSTP
jgi:hypothetical protein